MKKSNIDPNLWLISQRHAENQCEIANKRGLGINEFIHRFKPLVPQNVIDVENWDDAAHYITIAIYSYTLYYVAENISLIIK